MSGHTVPAHAMAFSPDGSFAVSAAPSERHVAVWACDQSAASASKKAAGASAVLSMEHPAAQLSTSRTATDAEFFAVCVSQVGEAYLWRCGLNGQMVGSCRIRITVPKGVSEVEGCATECVLALRHQGVTEGALVVRGSLAKPTFQRVKGVEEGVVELPASTDEGGLKPKAEGPAGKDARRLAATKGVAVLGAENAMDADVIRPAASSVETRKRKGGEDSDEDSDEEAEAPSGMDEDDGDASDEDTTLGERLSALGLAGVDAMSAEGTHRRGGADAAEVAAPLPKADSLGVLVAQAVRAGDRALLERCLAVADVAVVSNTVARLAPMDALALLEQLLLRLQARPGRGMQLACWLRAVVVSHPAYLMAAPGARKHMTALFQMLEARVAMLRPLLTLAGRLDLLLAQQQNASANRRKGASKEGPLVEYIEADEPEELEVEDPFAFATADIDADGSEGSSDWETDDGEGTEGMEEASGDDEDEEEEEDA
mmetsp:Transcript_3545/g.5995  ORF Transcript_3545/g.5995 Transcript_3545/m.5995 type:complete len:486 (-) Transcript_3545:1031-2488(-)